MHTCMTLWVCTHIISLKLHKQVSHLCDGGETSRTKYDTTLTHNDDIPCRHHRRVKLISISEVQPSNYL